MDATDVMAYEARMIAQTMESNPVAMIEDPAGLLAVLLAVLATIFWLADHPVTGKFFKIVPMLIFCYFVPTTLTTFGVIPEESPLYSWIKNFVLPASLLLLILALDVPAIIRLGPKAIVMLLAGTTGVVVGGPIALWLCQPFLPPDAWQGMSALAGSWIGGGANFLAIGEQAGASDKMMATMVVPDVFVANIWMGVLLFFAGKQHAIDRWTGADASAIRDLEHRLTDFQARVNRIPAISDLMMILALGFAGSWASYEIGLLLPEYVSASGGTIVSHSTWKFVLVTTVGVVLSFTRARNLEGAGASRIGGVMIYLLVACIGASANFRSVATAPWFVVTGFVWMAIHVTVLLAVAKLIRAPIFFVAVGSQANIGGAASAPVVASAFHPSLAAVGALLAVAGYVLGTYAGLVCMHLLKMVAGASP